MYNNYNINEIQREKFYQVPKVFFTNPRYTSLSSEAKLAYAILRDRLNLSIKNNWIDENGDVFFIYTNENLKNILNISSPNKLSKIKKELRSADLFNQIRRGVNKPNLLYLKKPILTKEDVYQINIEEDASEDYDGADVSFEYNRTYHLNTVMILI